MNLDEIITIKKTLTNEFTSISLSDYLILLTYLTERLNNVRNNKDIPSLVRVNLSEDIDMLNSVINDLKKIA